ncbi:MAG: ABC transporter ATP-binding protein [Negativicutes bacterium]|nr:ABC transporter ATP-binding protein [Negativicutes bacterium]
MSIIKVRGLTKKFGGLVAVSKFDMEVEENEIVGLIGPNGAGKTTVFNMIACYLNPSEGEIFFREQNITNLVPHQICNLGIARTFQVTKPFGDMTLLENIMVGAFHRTADEATARRKADEMYELFKFAGSKEQSAHNLTTVDRKKLEVARALATDPKLLLLDEVMAGCNPSEKLEIVDLLFRLRKLGITIIVIEHDMKTIMSLCDRVIVLNRGEKLVEGTPEEVSNDKRAISAYLGEEYACLL